MQEGTIIGPYALAVLAAGEVQTGASGEAEDAETMMCVAFHEFDAKTNKHYVHIFWGHLRVWIDESHLVSMVGNVLAAHTSVWRVCKLSDKDVQRVPREFDAHT